MKVNVYLDIVNNVPLEIDIKEEDLPKLLNKAHRNNEVIGFKAKNGRTMFINPNKVLAISTDSVEIENSINDVDEDNNKVDISVDVELGKDGQDFETFSKNVIKSCETLRNALDEVFNEVSVEVFEKDAELHLNMVAKKMNINIKESDDDIIIKPDDNKRTIKTKMLKAFLKIVGKNTNEFLKPIKDGKIGIYITDNYDIVRAYKIGENTKYSKYNQHIGTFICKYLCLNDDLEKDPEKKYAYNLPFRKKKQLRNMFEKGEIDGFDIQWGDNRIIKIEEDDLYPVGNDIVKFFDLLFKKDSEGYYLLGDNRCLYKGSIVSNCVESYYGKVVYNIIDAIHNNISTMYKE